MEILEEDPSYIVYKDSVGIHVEGKIMLTEIYTTSSYTYYTKTLDLSSILSKYTIKITTGVVTYDYHPASTLEAFIHNCTNSIVPGGGKITIYGATSGYRYFRTSFYFN